MNKKHTKQICHMAVITAFHNMDFCPGTKFYEVMDQDVFDDIIQNAQDLITYIGLDASLIDCYVVSKILFGMKPKEFDDEMEEIKRIRTSEE